jgi:hypothetical protein
MRALLVGSVIVLAVVWPGAGRAAQAPDRGTLVASPRFIPEAGPLLVGADGIAWVSRRDDRVLDLWLAAAGVRGAHRVQRFSGSDSERLRPVALSASGQTLTLALTVVEAGRARSEVYRGLFGEPLVRDAAAPAPDAPAGVAPARMVWVARACRSAEIRTVALPAAGRLAHREPACRLRLRRHPRVHEDRLRFGVSCAGFRISCSARVRVRARGRVIARGVARYNHTTPPFAAAGLRLSSYGRRLLRAHPRAALRISARYGDLATRVVVARAAVR